MSQMKERDRVVQLVRLAFGYLEQTFGYALAAVDEDQREREVTVTFTRDTGFVRVRCTAPCAVTVEVARLAGTPRRAADNFWHIYLVRDAHPEDEERLVALVQQNAGLRKVLPAFAASLRRSGSDLLEGDYSRAARLKRLRAEHRRRVNQKKWGTATGETPRFSTRPTLEQLFADAPNQDIRQAARCYQALWDYGFSRAEIAAFLSTDEAEVQRLLNWWDGL